MNTEQKSFCDFLGVEISYLIRTSGEKEQFTQDYFYLESKQDAHCQNTKICSENCIKLKVNVGKKYAFAPIKGQVFTCTF